MRCTSPSPPAFPAVTSCCTGNNKPDEPALIETIAKRLDKRAKMMLRVTSGIHTRGGHEYVSTAHEDQKSDVPLPPPPALRRATGIRHASIHR